MLIVPFPSGKRRRRGKMTGLTKTVGFYRSRLVVPILADKLPIPPNHAATGTKLLSVDEPRTQMFAVLRLGVVGANVRRVFGR